MKSKQPASSKKPAVALKDLTTKKNPKGGAPINTSRSNKRGDRSTGIACTPSAGGSGST